ncbi:hypothetical protein D3C78_1873170 [compost metagenome]
MLIGPGHGDLAFPPRAKIVCQLGKRPLCVDVPVGPGLADAGASAAVVDGIARVVGHRQGTPGAAVGIALLFGKTDGQGIGV